MASCAFSPLIAPKRHCAPIAVAEPAPLFLRTPTDPAEIDNRVGLTGGYSRDAHFRFQKVHNGIVVTVSNFPDACGVACSSERVDDEFIEDASEEDDQSVIEKPSKRMTVEVGCLILSRHNRILVLPGECNDKLSVPSGPVFVGETFDMAIRRNIHNRTKMTLPPWPAELFHCLESWYCTLKTLVMKPLFGPFLVEEECDFEPSVNAPAWMAPSELYSRFLADGADSRISASMVKIFEHLAKRYRALYEFSQDECYRGARDAASNPLMFELCHMELNDGSIDRNNLHSRAGRLARERLNSTRN